MVSSGLFEHYGTFLQAQKARVASLYLPLLSIVMQSLDKLQWQEDQSMSKQVSLSDIEPASPLVMVDQKDGGGSGGKKMSISSSTSSGFLCQY